MFNCWEEKKVAMISLTSNIQYTNVMEIHYQVAKTKICVFIYNWNTSYLPFHKTKICVFMYNWNTSYLPFHTFIMCGRQSISWPSWRMFVKQFRFVLAFPRFMLMQSLNFFRYIHSFHIRYWAKSWEYCCHIHLFRDIVLRYLKSVQCGSWSKRTTNAGHFMTLTTGHYYSTARHNNKQLSVSLR